MTLNASTHGCLTRACIFRPVRYQVCARVVPNGTVLDCAAANRAVADGVAGFDGVEGFEGSESICMVVMACSLLWFRTRSPVRGALRSPTRCSGARYAAGT